jgi:hypothetical protein
MPGSKVQVWKQDPSVASLGISALFIHTTIMDGPRDAEIEVELPGCEVRPNAEGDFIFDPDLQPLEFDAVHTFATVRQIVTMYRRILARLGRQPESLWHWGPELPLRLRPRAGTGYVACYVRDRREINLYSFEAAAGRLQGQTVHACRSFDLIAHETGHAILDGLNPGYGGAASEVGALREAFADLTVLFGTLAQLDQCERLIVETRGDLSSRNFCQVIGEQIGEALHGDRRGLRMLSTTDWRGKEFANQHELSLVFSGAIYQIMIELFNHYSKFEMFDPAESLYRVAKKLSKVVVQAFLRPFPYNHPTFSELARLIVDCANPALHAIFMDEFERRRIL